MPTDIRELNERAVMDSVAAVSKVRPEDLGRPTPCAGWTVLDLLEHMAAQHRGFAATAAGHGSDPAVWQVSPLGADPVAAYIKAADGVVRAFAVAGVLRREFELPEFSTSVTFPAVQAIGFHLIDYVVHGWDVARSIGMPYELDPVVAKPAHDMARQVPDGPERLHDGAAFRPAVPFPEDASTLDRIVAMLGRSPTWPDGHEG